MILADTSIWIDHFHGRDSLFQQVLIEQRVAIHEFVIGELLCGTLPQRMQTRKRLQTITRVPTVGHADVLAFVESHHLSGLGLGWRDIHLLVAAHQFGTRLLTHDKALFRAANRLNVLSAIARPL